MALLVCVTTLNEFSKVQKASTHLVQLRLSQFTDVSHDTLPVLYLPGFGDVQFEIICFACRVFFCNQLSKRLFVFWRTAARSADGRKPKLSAGHELLVSRLRLNYCRSNKTLSHYNRKRLFRTTTPYVARNKYAKALEMA